MPCELRGPRRALGVDGCRPRRVRAPDRLHRAGADQLEVGDFDGDAIPDVLVVGYIERATLLLGQGDGGLVVAGDTPVGSTNCSDLAVADLDGDGNLDFATTCESQQTTTDDNEQATAFLGAGDGTFTHFATLRMTEPRGLALADLDGDDRPELLATSFSPQGDDRFLAYHNTGAGFELASSFPFAWGGDVTAADLDGDGDLDVLAAQEWEPELLGALAMYRNDAGTLVEAAVMDLDGSPLTVETADVDGDGNLDYAVVGNDGLLQIGRGDGEGGFTAAEVFGTGSGQWTVALPDVDADGAVDLVYASARGVTVRASGSDGFAPPSTIESAANPFAVDLADHDGDGALDLLIASETTLELRRGDAQGGFTHRWTGEAPTDMLGMASADVDGDGRIDLAIAATSGLSLRRGDGEGGFADPMVLDTSVLTGAPRVADVDGDGAADVVAVRDGGIVVAAGGGVQSYSVDSITVRAVALGDLDGDGATDYAIAGGQNLHILPGDGAGGVGAAVNLPFDGGLARVVLADLDGDGDLDAVGNGHTHAAGVIFGGLAWFDNDGGQLQAPEFTPPAGMEVGALVVTDLDRDGRDDIVTVEDANMSMSVYRGIDGPGLAYAGTFAITGIEVSDWLRGRDAGIAAGDADGDGLVDLAFADLGRDRVVWMRGDVGVGGCVPEG